MAEGSFSMTTSLELASISLTMKSESMYLVMAGIC